MKFTLKTFIGAAAVASIAFAGTANADPVKCHAAIGKNITKYQATLAKNLIGCHKSRNADTTDADCNTTAGADLKLKASAAEAALVGAITAACPDPAGVDAPVLAMYTRCPSPVALADGADGITTFTEVANCLAALSEAYINRIGVQVMGVNPPTLKTKPQQACVNAIGKTVSKAIKTAGKTRTKCQNLQEKTALAVQDYALCAGPGGDSSSKISGALAAINTAIDTSCADGLVSKEDKAALGLCGSIAADLKVCVNTRTVGPTANGLAAATQELEGQCASYARVNINAAYGTKLSDTRLDAGFSGLGHGVDVIDLSVGGVEISGCDADCENCDITNDPTPGQCRCSNNVTIQCDAGPEQPDADDCGGNTCNCFFGPPLPLNSGGTPVCVQNKFAKEFTGGTFAVGEYDVGTRTRAIVHTGIGQLQPCPRCSGAINAAGTCSGGARNGLACTTNAIHPDFGATSFDCPPNANVSGAGINLGLQFTSGSTGFTAAINNASHCSGGTCHCSQCSLDALVGCASTADCDAAAIDAGGVAGDKGTCGSNLGADNPKPNACTGATPTCEPDGLGMGACDFDGMNTGPVDSTCDGVTAERQNGEGILPCGVDADCQALDAICGGDCGDCTNSKARSCFLPAISATGSPGIFNSDGVSSFCSARTSNPGVNSAGGLPGPGRVRLDFDFDIMCSDNVTPYQLPDGSNCP